MRTFILIIFIFCLAQSFGQAITKYYDTSWKEVPKDKAAYSTEMVKDGDVYHYISHYSNSGKLYSTSTYADSNFAMEVGVRKVYYKSGKLRDSAVYGQNGQLQTVDEFLEDGKQKTHAFYDEKEHYMKGESFDSNGNKTGGYFTFQKQAMFPGGVDGWVQYLQTHLKADIPTRRKAPAGNYVVRVTFLVDAQGRISEVEALNDPGYGTAQEAVRVIKNGPNWLPAVQNNKPVVYRQRQTITFQVIEVKK